MHTINTVLSLIVKLWLLDWLVSNANFSSISAISWRKQILYIKNRRRSEVYSIQRCVIYIVSYEWNVGSFHWVLPSSPIKMESNAMISLKNIRNWLHQAAITQSNTVRPMLLIYYSFYQYFEFLLFPLKMTCPYNIFSKKTLHKFTCIEMHFVYIHASNLKWQFNSKLQWSRKVWRYPSGNQKP
jgi:hypothetical protein